MTQQADHILQDSLLHLYRNTPFPQRGIAVIWEPNYNEHTIEKHIAFKQITV